MGNTSSKRSRSELALLIRGTVIHSPSLDTFVILDNAVFGIGQDGRVAFLEDNHEEELPAGGSLILRDGGAVTLPKYHYQIVVLPPRGFICPGLVDTHTHAPQSKNAGIGYDLQLLEWLTKYTFPTEAAFDSLSFAAKVCRNAVSRTLRNGTTSCLYFATIHTDAAVQLGRIASGMGQRAFIGKVNMDRNAPDFYVEASAKASLAETERFIDAMLKDESDGGKGQSVGDGGICVECEPLGPPAQPVICPRFVPTCTPELMKGLGKLSNRNGGLLITSHVSENKGEIAWVRELHPELPTYTSCYDDPGLLTPRTILAHGVYLDKEERALLRSRKSTVSHCPVSNCMLRSGMLNVRRMLEEGNSVALGTDVSGGAPASMLTAVREALKVSNMVSLTDKRPEGEEGGMYAPLTAHEAFHLATAAGARSLCVEGLTGDFTVGSVFDAVVINPEADGSPFDIYDGEWSDIAFEKWLILGDDRNTDSVYVNGKKVLG